MKTVSLELSKQLKKAGYPQEPLSAYWYKNKEARYLNGTTEMNYSINLFPGKVPDWSDYKEDEYFASPTADEILDLLPRSIGGVCWRVGPTLAKVDSITIEYGDSKDCQHGDSLAEAAAKMWLYLKKEKLL